MTTPRAEELKLDIKDLNDLFQIAQRQKSKDVISLELRRLQTELLKEMEKVQPDAGLCSRPVSVTPKCYEVKISSHGWDQNDKFVKIYVPLKNVHTLNPESVICNYTDRSVHLRVLGLDNKNHDLLINNLCEEIIPEKCSLKIKTDNIVVNLAKKDWKTWSHMTEVEKRLKKSKETIPEVDKEDPGASLMNMMKKMYQEGDDDMKRMISKAWTESREKNQAMDFS